MSLARIETIERYTFTTVPTLDRLERGNGLHPIGGEEGKELVVAWDAGKRLVGTIEVYDPRRPKVSELRNFVMKSVPDNKTVTIVSLEFLRYLWQKGMRKGLEGYDLKVAASAIRNFDYLGLDIKQTGPPEEAFGSNKTVGTIIPSFLLLDKSAVSNPGLWNFLKTDEFYGFPEPKWKRSSTVSYDSEILQQRISLGIY